MRRSLSRVLDVPASQVIEALHDLDHADRWVGGLIEHRAEHRPDGTTDLVLKLRAPRTLSLRLEVTRLPDGLKYALVEGDAAAAEGQLTVLPDGGGARVTWDYEVAVPVAVPRVLVRELDNEVLPRWLSNLG